MIYVYAVAEGLHDVSDLCGVAGEPLELLDHSGAQVVVGGMATRPPIDGAVLRAQDALVRALHERARALLPLRFGAASATRAEVLQALAAKGELLARLAAVRDCEQMVLRVFGTSVPPSLSEPQTSSGAEYLRARANRLRPPPLLEQLASAGGALVKGTRIESAVQPGVVGSVYHLVARGSADDYRRAIDQAMRPLEDIRVAVSGPSPPYAFA